MRKLSSTISCLTLLFGILIMSQPAVAATTPSYAKWGQIAMKTAKEKYPNANIIDYLHIGREDKAQSSIEKFKLWIDDQGKEFGLYINIEFDPKNDRIININTRKSNN